VEGQHSNKEFPVEKILR